MAAKALSAGFTGDVVDPDSVSVRARSVADRARDEAGMVVAHATDHPAATGSVLAVVALVALTIGYALGSSSKNRSRFW
ncbi:hypothetical protein EPK99_13040 [Neorhizobium lilium]|uniref:Uncharacterized protein n=1 Tax=Neorhizobium lilium TaxID=2503024 RepID=A0A444LEI6_9HYPH|nr:hypothetical protein [Neorhizobium lilium]RWX76608.1 hypothetical protein EPK99_13040 [Neorhizobium lilium]